MKNVCSKSLNAGVLSSSFAETIKSFISIYQAYNLMNTVKETPTYWKKIIFEVLAIEK